MLASVPTLGLGCTSKSSPVQTSVQHVLTPPVGHALGTQSPFVHFRQFVHFPPAVSLNPDMHTPVRPGGAQQSLSGSLSYMAPGPEFPLRAHAQRTHLPSVKGTSVKGATLTFA